MSELKLRPMTTADLDGVLGLELALFGEESWSRQMLVGELGQQPASRFYLVAEDDGTIVGYAGLLAAGGQADVLTIAVAAARWGQGVGSELLRQLLAEARRRGCTEAFLEVRADNARAQRLYHWWGFTEVGIRHGYYQPSGMDAIVMRLDLSGPAPARPGDADGTAVGYGGSSTLDNTAVDFGGSSPRDDTAPEVGGSWSGHREPFPRGDVV